MEFQEAIELHLDWKHRFFAALRSEKRHALDPQMLGSTSNCPLGQWIESHIARGSADHLFARLQVEHLEFHRFAAFLVQSKPENLPPTQLMLMDGQMQELSGQIVETLRLLSLRGKDFPTDSIPV